MHEAMDWLVRLHEPQVCDSELAEWTLWYEADERHQQAFEQMQDLWIRAGALAEGPQGLGRLDRLLRPPREADARHRHLGPRIALAASVVAAAVGVAWLSHRLFHARPPTSAAAPLVRRLALPDGTSLEVAPGTRIVVRYTAALRRVAVLGGEAYFSVRHDPSRPFLVTVNGLTVRDVGTAFNVRKADSRANVTVVRGEIEVSPSSAAASRGHVGVRVNAGEEVTWGSHAHWVVERTDTRRALAWRQGRLEYIDEPLSAVIADVDRYAHHPVVLGDKAAGRIAFTGTVFARYADQWVRALPSEFPVRLVSRPGRALVLESRTDKQP